MPLLSHLVVPCYNESQRLDGEAFLRFVKEQEDVRVLFVNDGSKDDTLDKLRALEQEGAGRVAVLNLEQNRGKAEAVRQGLRQALESGAQVVGYLDADLATPLDEMRRLLAAFFESKATVLLASRVALLGRSIERSRMRHYLGRIFATAASVVLRSTIYDTQCGAKLFKRTPALEAALADPFLSRWAFDVELLGRLLIGAPGVDPIAPTQIVEEPLHRWKDVPGSKLRFTHMAGAAQDLVAIGRDLAARRQKRHELDHAARGT